MARLLNEIEWGKPILPLESDPKWSAEVEHSLGSAAVCHMYAAPSAWLRTGLLRWMQVKYNHAPPELVWLTTLVTSQENACRYCYGVALHYLRLLGLSEKRIQQVERDARVAGADPKETAVLLFSRNLSRSRPRPAYREIEDLIDLGVDPRTMVDLAMAVVSSCFINRYATFIAVPLLEDDPAPKASVSGWFKTTLAKLLKTYPRPLAPTDPPSTDGPFGRLVALLGETDGAGVLDDMLRGALSSEVLPRRTAAWMFAVIATALECKLCAEGAHQLLRAEGFSDERIEAVISALAGPELDETEAILLPWTRETVHYETEIIQRKTRELADKLEPRVTLEAVGLASLANACARLSLLERG